MFTAENSLEFFLCNLKTYVIFVSIPEAGITVVKLKKSPKLDEMIDIFNNIKCWLK